MTRLEAARRRLRIARFGIGVAAVSLFAAFGVVVRNAHPGARSSSIPASSSSVATATEDDSFGFFGSDDDSSSIGPSGSATPSIQSGGS